MTWNIDDIVAVFGRVHPPAVELVRALVSEGGRASPDRLRNLMRRSPNGLRQLLTHAFAEVTGHVLPGQQLVVVRRAPDPRNSPITEYRLAEGTLELAAAALERFDST
ncbi:hypothetical protein ACIBJI_40040 [Nocardia sp. NPDC050408]|uniref:hypothetical protein n=1 Tax=Nocardia sp. NPDC050408 TaxID=3364319 RepID=UPI0037B3CF59